MVESLIKFGADINAVEMVSLLGYFDYAGTYHNASQCFVLPFRKNGLHYIQLLKMVIVQQ